MDIIIPDTDPAEVYPQVRVRFLAEARDEKGNDVSDRATFSWTFSDAEDSTVGNPVLHRFPKVGKFLVSVTATLDSDSGCDETTVIVIPYEGGGLRQAPGVGDFTFTANGHTPPAEVSDDVGLLVEQVGDIEPFWWVGTEFQVYEGGQWVAPEDQAGDPEYGWFTTVDPYYPNGPVAWRAKVMLDEIGAEPPNGIDLYLPGTWTVVNTVVKARASDLPLIFHHAEDTSHTIGWELTHCEDSDPRFTMTVTIYDLEGNTVATEVRYNVPLEEQNPEIVWDTNLPEEDGIYTYRIHASHNPPPPYYACVDDDKSQVLTISDVSTPEWDLEVLSATQAELTYSVSYQLSRDATWIGVSIYDQNFQPIVSAAPLPTTSGSHESDTSVVPITLTAGWHGPYSVVVYGWESEEDGANNRDGLIKRALQRGVVRTFPPEVLAFCRKDSGDPWVSWRPIAVNQQMRFCGFDPDIPQTITKREWNFGDSEDWLEVGAVDERYHTYTSVGEKTATYRITLQNQTTMQDTCQVTVFGFDGSNYLWFFDGCQPANYPTTGTLTATGASTGIFRWQITAGTDKANFTGEYPTNVTKVDNNTVELMSVGPSTTSPDVAVWFYYRRDSYPEYYVYWVPATILTPLLGKLIGPEDRSYAVVGFWTTYRYSVRSFPVAGNLPASLPVNESFGAEGSDYEGEDWDRAAPDGTATGAAWAAQNYPADPELHTFEDFYAAWGPFATPPTLPPDPGGDPEGEWMVKVYWRQQYYRAGSSSPGQGLLMKSTKLQMHRGCGRNDL